MEEGGHMERSLFSSPFCLGYLGLFFLVVYSYSYKFNLTPSLLGHGGN